MELLELHPFDIVEIPAMYKILSSTPKETDKMKDTFRKNALVVEMWSCKSRLFEIFFKNNNLWSFKRGN